MANNKCNDNTRDIISDKLREQMQEIREDVLGHLSNRMDNMVSEILQKVDGAVPNKTTDFTELDKYSDKIKSDMDILPSKQFLERNSILTDLYENKHIRTVYNIFITILILLFINTAMHDIASTGLPNLGINTIMIGFGKFPIVIYVWLLMKGSTVGVYYSFCYWARRHVELLPRTSLRKTWDYAWLAVLILYQITFFILPTRKVLKENLPVASSLIILMEQVRMLMKTHAFVRSLAPRFLSYKPHSETPVPQAPTTSHFFYFMFAPTLVYQDSYPRTKKIRWRIVMVHFAEVILVIFCVTFIYERCLRSTYWRFGTEPIEWRYFMLNILGTTFAGILFMLCGFYCLLHAWLNAFAELLQFADKMFYKDWWNSINYSRYYRTWNIVVHDWLYTYIYKDMYEIVTSQNKTLSICAVFLISAIVHEYILTFAFRFFYPVLFLLFGGPGLIVVFAAKRAGNIFLWFGLCLGSGLLLSLYSMEYYARINCPSYHDELLDFFLPRTWLCLLNLKS